MWDLAPWPGIEPGSLHWGHEILATGPPVEISGETFSFILVFVKSQKTNDELRSKRHVFRQKLACQRS